MTDEQMRSAVEEIDSDLFEIYRQEALAGKPCPGIRRVNTEAHKNRYQVCSKLTPPTYAALYAYAKANNYNMSSAIKQLITTHPLLNHG
jgi:hypothetical protein